MNMTSNVSLRILAAFIPENPPPIMTTFILIGIWLHIKRFIQKNLFFSKNYHHCATTNIYNIIISSDRKWKLNEWAKEYLQRNSKIKQWEIVSIDEHKAVSQDFKSD
jgi:hypothetical protein